MQNFRASNYNTNIRNTASNLNKANITGNTNVFSNRATENRRSVIKRNSNISSNLSNKNYHKTVSFYLNFNRNDREINGDTNKINSKKVKINPDKNSINSAEPDLKSEKRHYKENISVDIKTNSVTNKKVSNKQPIAYKQKNSHSNTNTAVNNRISSIDVIGRDSELHEVKELLPKKNSKNLFVKNQFYKEDINCKNINNKNNKNKEINNNYNDSLNKKELGDNNNQVINNLGIDNFLNEFKRHSNNADINNNNILKFENQSSINNLNDNNAPPKSHFSEEMKSSPVNELDPKSYLSFLNANILKINNDKTEAVSKIYTQSKTENTTDDQNQNVFIKNKYKLLIENFKN